MIQLFEYHLVFLKYKGAVEVLTSLSFSTSTCFFLFELNFLKIFSLSSKSVFFTKLAISLLLAKFARANLAAKFSAVNLINSGVVI